VGKFGRTELWENPMTGEKAIVKTLSILQASVLVKNQLINESQFSFKYPGLPREVKLLTSSSELKLVKRFQEGIPLTEFWKNKLKASQKYVFLKKFTAKFTAIYEILEQQKIIHGDIKPANILINGNFEEFEVELIDFGLAFTQYNNMIQRPLVFQLGYSAPELVLNQLDIANNTSDIYSFNLILYFLITGQHPFKNPNPSIATNLQITYPLTYDSRIPPLIWKTMTRALKKHSFNKPPNLLPLSEVRSKLQSAMNERFSSMTEYQKESQVWPETYSLFTRMKAIFGYPNSN
jgi:eukaryotic-like serine/threonine-protein kinase